MIKLLPLSSALAKDRSITEQEVLAAQKAWADGIMAIRKVFIEKGNYKERAKQHIKDLYAYDLGEVLFKPTFASDVQFRDTFEKALSYFIGNNLPEDNGFAIMPWSNVRFGNQKIIINTDTAIAMGNYFLTPAGSDKEVRVEYTFGYIKDNKGNVRINVHHSSMPYSRPVT